MIEQKKEKVKTRDLHIYDFLEMLQVEYVSAELRAKIYPNIKDKAYYRDRVMYFKKQKIEDICERNPGLPNIFNNDGERRRIYDMIYNDWGMPNFHYKDQDHKDQFEDQDFDNYFMKDCTVRIRTDEKEEKALVGYLMDVNRDKNIAYVKIKGKKETKPVSLKNIARIL